MKIAGGLVFDLENGFVERDVYTDGTLISRISGDDIILDAADCYVIPGLVDVHFHGCAGEDFSDAAPEGLQAIADYELSEGVTYICPAAMTLPEQQLINICKNAAAHRASFGSMIHGNGSASDSHDASSALMTHSTGSASGAEMVGMHLEGPFLSLAKKGAQNVDFLHKPDIDMLHRLQKAANGCIRLVTVAPEEPDAMEFIRAAAADGIIVSLGHTAADYDTAYAAYKAGASHATHLYNGMLPLYHRTPGVIGAAFDAPHVKVELICDGIHIHGSVIRATFQLFGKERVVLVSDSLRATGMPDGQYPFGGQEIEVHGNRATIVGHPDTLAGSVTSLMGCLRQAVKFGIPLADAVRAASYNPAQVIKIDQRAGTLDIGKEASIVLLNKEDLSIRAVIFKGNLRG